MVIFVFTKKSAKNEYQQKLFFFKIGGVDKNYCILELNPKAVSAAPSYEDIKDFVETHLAQSSLVWTDSAAAYEKAEKEHPELFAHLRQVNHTEGEWTK